MTSDKASVTVKQLLQNLSWDTLSSLSLTEFGMLVLLIAFVIWMLVKLYYFLSL